MVWIDSVRSRAYQTANVTASATAKTTVLDSSGDAEIVGEIVGDQRADDADQHDGEPVDGRHVAPARNCTTSTTTKQRRHHAASCRSGPRPRFSLR